MSSLEFGKLEVNTEKSIRETDEEIIVPAILERESILQYDEGMGYRSAEELQKAAWLLNGTPILLYRHAWPIWNFSQDDVKDRFGMFRGRMSGLLFWGTYISGRLPVMSSCWRRSAAAA